MVDVGYQRPSNAILVAGDPLVQFLKIETVTNCYAGRLVKKGTNDDDVVVCGAGEKPGGWLGYEQTHKQYRPTTVDTIYKADDQVAVLNGGRFVIVARLANGETVSKNDPLVAAANGEVKAASALAVTVPSGATPVTSDAAQPDLTESGSIPPEGMIVAIAEESVDASGGAEDIMVRSLI